jgi:hypothetical protein
MHTVDPLLPESSCFKVEIARHYILRSKGSLILFGIRKNCHSDGWDLLLKLFIKGVIKLTVVIVQGYHCYHTKCYPIFLSQG